MSETSPARAHGRSTAFLVGEVVDLAERLARDEAGVLAALAQVRSQVIGPALAGRSKRFVEAPGDALLIWLERAEDALLCAAALQRLAGVRNAAADKGFDVVFRLGVGLLGPDGGDAADQGLERALGLLAACEPGGLVVSPGLARTVADRKLLPAGTAREDGTVVLAASAMTLLPAPPQRRTTSWWQDSTGPGQTVGPGTRLNETYEIDELIGSGGMGEIFRGHEIHSDGTVAIKVIRPNLSGDEAVLALFQKEASVLKQIFNEGIVRYYAFSYDGTLRLYYLAMEFVEGTPLSELIRDHPLPHGERDALRRRLAGALRVAHGRGIVHRDISPDNIIVPGHALAQAKIIDFGIARSTAVGAGTIVGTGFAGKYAYASPEQLGLNGGEVTGKSDVYSLGLVLAEAATGRRMDMGGREVEVLEKRRSVPDLSAVDPNFRPLIEAMLQPDPTLRPDMASVENWAPGEAPPGRAFPDRTPDPERRAPRRRKAVPIVFGALLLLGGAGLEAYFALPHPSPQPPTPPILQPNEPPTPAPPPTPPPVTPPAPPLDKASLIRAIATDFSKGACFFAQPVSIRADGAGIEGFGRSRDDFERMDKAITQAVGFSPDITGHIVWSPQCAAIDFLSRTARDDAGAPSLFLRRTALHAGQSLSGSIEGAGARSLALLRVAEDGTVTNLADSLKKRDEAWTFEVPLAQAGGSRTYPNLVIAIATPKPLGLGSQPRPADQFFPDLARSGDPDLRAAIKMILVGG
jgi:serine/threonine protein kinase